MKIENCTLKTEHSLRWLEGILVTVVLCVTALRLTFIELPQNAMQNPALWTTARGISLILSSILFLTALAGFLLRIHKIRWDRSYWPIALGLTLFTAATIAAILNASDKRAAETECITLIVPALVCLIASRWLDSMRRINVVLWVILSICCAAVYVNIDQAVASNQDVAEDYQKDPQRQLKILGIEPNSLGQFQYEHRLMSKDVHGFLTTSNSTGSFLLLGIFIVLGLIADTLRSNRNDEGFASRITILCLILLALAAGLVIGKSRGAIGAGAIAVIVFGLLLGCGPWIWKRRLPVLAGIAVLFVLLCTLVVFYGLKHGRLPGPNAMLVRWQYWVSSVQMAADYPLFGVGGGNFATFYPHYKIPAAPETVRDPHNVILSLLCQFGPLGVLGFLIATLGILWMGLKTSLGSPTTPSAGSRLTSADKIIPFGVLTAVALTLLYFRPIVSEGGVAGETAIIRQSVFVILYLVPVFFVVCSYGLLWAGTPKQSTTHFNKGLMLGLICGIIAILIHNLIDFAIFEPGIWSAFWIILALIIALANNHSTHQTCQPKASKRFVIGVISLAVGIVFIIRTYPPIYSGYLFQLGLKDLADAQDHLIAAAKADKLDPAPYFFAAQWQLQLFESQHKKQLQPLDQAKVLLAEAQRRDPQNYRYSNLIGDILALKSELEKDKQNEYLNAAYNSMLAAQRLYPGFDEIAYKLGQLAEKLNELPKAAKHYREAIEIEDQYRLQFSLMYPGTPLFSRLGESRYMYAKNFLAQYPDTK